MVKVYLEGGGESNSLRRKCREGFHKLARNAGMSGKMPRFVACGTRSVALDRFTTAINNNEDAILLVDSEAPVPSGLSSPWQFLESHEGESWRKPHNATDDHCQLMVQCMEAWFLADKGCLQRFYGQGFQAGALPAQPNIEAIDKECLFISLNQATRNTKTKGKYAKGDHSFDLLADLDVGLLEQASPWAKRFFDELRNV